MKKFWCVVANKPGQSRREFTCEHNSLCLATKEAERLSKSTPGVDFLVLELVGHVGPLKAPVAWQKAEPNPNEGVPF